MENEIKERSRLQLKLTRAIMAVVFVIFFFVALVIVVVYSRYYRDQIVESKKSQLLSTTEQINYLQSTVSNIAKQIAVDAELQTWIAKEQTVTAGYLVTKQNIRRSLATYTHLIDGIPEILIYTADFKTFSSIEVRDDFKPEEAQWYQEYLSSEKQNGYTKIHLATPLQTSFYDNVVSYVLTYYSADGAHRKIGDMIINLNVQQIQRLIKIDPDYLQGYILYDGEGNVILGDGDITLSYDEIVQKGADGSILAQNGDEYLVSDSMQDGWKMVTVMSGSDLNRQKVIIGAFFAMGFFLLAIVLYFVITYFIRRVVNPVNELAEAAVEVGNGNFNTSVDIRTGDELEVLANVFNNMVVDIRKLMDESEQNAKLKRKMQVDQLMLQINPHFIYNTLNSIVYMAHMDHNQEIADFANAFISLLQSTLRVRNTIYISLKEELNNVENYLMLQKYRYGDKFSTKIECAEELWLCAIPSVMLQPIVENAIFHGIAPKADEGHLWITVEKIGNNVKIVVQDDGVGMSQEKIDSLLQDEQVNTSGLRKIGIANVSSRMQEIYGVEYSLTIESEIDKGTRVTITIPWSEYQGESGNQ